MIRSFPSNDLFAYPTKGDAAIFSVLASKQMYVYNVRAMNNSGSSINVGIAKKLFNPTGQSVGYSLYQYANSGPTVTEVTQAVDAGTATTLFDTTTNDGFIVSAKSHFNLLGFTISTGSTGSPVYTYKYWNGSAYTTLTTLEVPVYSSTGKVYVVFMAPVDWAKGGTTGTNQNMYSILVQATTAPSGLAAITSMWVGKFLEFYEGVANNAGVQLSFPDTKPLLLDGGESLIPYFSGTAAANQVGAYYSLV